MPFLEKILSGHQNIRQTVRSGLLIVTSAALGGIAVAIWNRRTLADIRRQPDETPEPPKPEA